MRSRSTKVIGSLKFAILLGTAQLLILSNAAIADTARQKAIQMWEQKVLPSIYSKNPPVTGLQLKDASSLLNKDFLATTFLREEDEVPEGRAKIVHTWGAVARVKWVRPLTLLGKKSKYTGILSQGATWGIARFSLASAAGDQGLIPALAFKWFIDGDHKSSNGLFLHSSEPQNGYNFFLNTLSNITPEPHGFIKTIGANQFVKGAATAGANVDPSSNRLTVTQLAEISTNGAYPDKVVEPFRLELRPTKFAQSLMPNAKQSDDFRENLAKVPAGRALYDIWAFETEDDLEGEYLGYLVTTTKIVASKYGDETLFFRHSKRNAGESEHYGPGEKKLVPPLVMDEIKETLAGVRRDEKKISLNLTKISNKTTPDQILKMIPAKNMNPHPGQGETPANLQGVYWMRGNPLADYLLSFSNAYWRNDGDDRFGFMSIFSPGSFVFKESMVAKDAPRTRKFPKGDPKFVPFVCRVPRDDKALTELAYLRSSHNRANVRRPIGDELQEMLESPSAKLGITPEAANKFVNSVWDSGQASVKFLGHDLVDGRGLHGLAKGLGFFYAAKFNRDYSAGEVHPMKLGLFPKTNALELPNNFASFSLAPHPYDKNIFIRKSVIGKGGEFASYYFLTRIIDGDGKAIQPYYNEFLDCVQQRSQGRILEVIR